MNTTRSTRALAALLVAGSGWAATAAPAGESAPTDATSSEEQKPASPAVPAEGGPPVAPTAAGGPEASHGPRLGGATDGETIACPASGRHQLIVSSGGVSMGSFEAGQLYMLLQYIQRCNLAGQAKADRENTTWVPYPVTLVGVSAGGINSTLGLAELYTSPVTTVDEKSVPEDSVLFKAWINAGITRDSRTSVDSHQGNLTSQLNKCDKEREYLESLFSRDATDRMLAAVVGTKVKPKKAYSATTKGSGGRYPGEVAVGVVTSRVSPTSGDPFKPYIRMNFAIKPVPPDDFADDMRNMAVEWVGAADSSARLPYKTYKTTPGGFHPSSKNEPFTDLNCPELGDGWLSFPCLYRSTSGIPIVFPLESYSANVLQTYRALPHRDDKLPEDAKSAITLMDGGLYDNNPRAFATDLTEAIVAHPAQTDRWNIQAYFGRTGDPIPQGHRALLGPDFNDFTTTIIPSARGQEFVDNDHNNDGWVMIKGGRVWSDHLGAAFGLFDRTFRVWDFSEGMRVAACALAGSDCLSGVHDRVVDPALQISPTGSWFSATSVYTAHMKFSRQGADGPPTDSTTLTDDYGAGFKLATTTWPEVPEVADYPTETLASNYLNLLWFDRCDTPGDAIQLAEEIDRLTAQTKFPISAKEQSTSQSNNRDQLADQLAALVQQLSPNLAGPKFSRQDIINASEAGSLKLAVHAAVGSSWDFEVRLQRLDDRECLAGLGTETASWKEPISRFTAWDLGVEPNAPERFDSSIQLAVRHRLDWILAGLHAPGGLRLPQGVMDLVEQNLPVENFPTEDGSQFRLGTFAQPAVRVVRSTSFGTGHRLSFAVHPHIVVDANRASNPGWRPFQPGAGSVRWTHSPQVQGILRGTYWGYGGGAGRYRTVAENGDLGREVLHAWVEPRVGFDFARMCWEACDQNKVLGPDAGNLSWLHFWEYWKVGAYGTALIFPRGLSGATSMTHFEQVTTGGKGGGFTAGAEVTWLPILNFVGAQARKEFVAWQGGSTSARWDGWSGGDGPLSLALVVDFSHRGTRATPPGVSRVEWNRGSR